MLIPIAEKWQNIGILLELSDQDLTSIDADGDSDIDHLRVMLRLWLSHVDPPPSWGVLAEAVEPFDTHIAAKIVDVCDHVSSSSIATGAVSYTHLTLPTIYSV